MKIPGVSIRSRAFTLLELLLVVVVLAVLLVLLYPVGQATLERNRALKCIQHLREMGSILHGVASENNGRLRLFRDGNALGEMRWYLQFKRFTGFSDEEAKKHFACPSLPSKDVSDWFCYGMRAGGSPGLRISETVKVGNKEVTGALYVFTVAAVQQPSKFLMAADSVGSSGKQTFRIVPPNLYSDGGIQVRHQGRANVLFLDGHVEALDLAGLYAAGIHQVYDVDRNSVSTVPDSNAPGGSDPES